MNLLICWMCLGLAGFLGSIAPVSGMPFFEDNDFMGGIKQYLGIAASDRTPGTNASHNKTAGGAVQESSSGFYDEMDTALEHATDTVDGLWQQFRKGLLSLMGSFSGSDDDSDGIDVATTTPSLEQMKPISTPIKTATNKVIADIPTTELPPPTIIATAATATTIAAAATATTTLETPSTVPTTTVTPLDSSTTAAPQ